MQFGKPSAFLKTSDVISWNIFSGACTNLKARIIKPPLSFFFTSPHHPPEEPPNINTI
jgi:hypothetical protein